MHLLDMEIKAPLRMVANFQKNTSTTVMRTVCLRLPVKVIQIKIRPAASEDASVAGLCPYKEEDWKLECFLMCLSEHVRDHGAHQ